MLNRISVRKAVLFSCAAACLAAMPAVTSASTVYTANWTGGTGDWSNSANWLYSPAAPSPATFPDDGNDGLDYAVQINTAGPTILDVSASVFALRIGINGTLATASGGSPVLNVGPDSFENDGKIEIVDNSSLTTGGTINNNGVINIGSGGTGGASTLIANGNTTLSGSGSVILAGGDSSIDGNGYALTVGSNISGTGTLKGFSTLTNNLTINANVAGGQLTISGGAVANNQLLEVSNGGTLALTNTTVSGTGPVDAIGVGSNLMLSGTTLNNINLDSNTGSVITVAAGAASLINNSSNGIFNINGTLNIADAATLNVEGNMGGGSGVLNVGDGSSPATLALVGTTTLGVTTVLNGQSVIQGNGNALTVMSTISGTGTLTGFSTLTNNLTINANVAGGQLTISGGAVANNQLLEVSNGGTLALTNTTVSGTGPVDAIGVGSNLILSGTTLDNVNLYTNSGSVITVAAGAASLINDTSGGNFNLNGTLNIADGATLNVEGNIGGGGSGAINVGDGSSPATLALVGTTGLVVNTVLNGESVIQGNGNALTVGSISGTGLITGVSTLSNYGIINANVAGGQLTISGGAVANSQIIEASSGGTLALINTTVSGNGQLDINGTGDNLILSGTTLKNVFLNCYSGSAITVAAGAASLIDNTGSGNFNLNGTLNIADGATLNLEGNIGPAGTGVINVGDGSSPATLALVGNMNLGVNTVLNGQSVIQGNGNFLTVGSISGTGLITGVSTLTNYGTIDANVAGKQLTISGGAVANSQIIEASNGGTLALTNTTVSGSGPVALNGTGANLILSGTTLNNITLDSNSGSVITVAAGAVSLINSGSGNFNLNGTLNIADGATLNVEGYMGGGGAPGVINVGDGSSLATLALVGNMNLGVNTVLNGQSVIQGNGNFLAVGSISGTGLITGVSTLANYGIIDANVPGGQLTISGGTVANSQIIEASNGGTLALTNTTVSGNGQLDINGTGANLIISGTTLSNVLFNSNSGSVITVAAGAASLINNTGNGSFNLNGTLNIADAATLNVEGNMGRSGGSGVINVGDGSSPATLALVGNTNLGVNTVLNGQSVIQGNGNFLTVGSISGTGKITGVSVLTNIGIINADVSFGQLEINGVTVVNSGQIDINNGGTMALTDTTVRGNGQVNLYGTGDNLILSGSTLDNVALAANSGSVITIAAGTASQITSANSGGVNINGTANIADGATLDVAGTIGFGGGGGSGVVNIGDGSSPATLALVGNTTLGVNTVLNGQSVITGKGNILAVRSTISGTGSLTGFSTLVNNGTIVANMAGGQLTISGGTIVNNSLMEASNGGTLALTNTTISGTGQVFLPGTGDNLILRGATLNDVAMDATTGSVITIATGAASMINSTGSGGLPGIGGTLDVAAAATLNIFGGIIATSAVTNNGSINVGSGGVIGTNVLLNNVINNGVITAYSHDTADILGTPGGKWVNNGTLRALAAGLISVTGNGTTVATEFASGSILDIQLGSSGISGRLEANGNLQLDSGSVISLSQLAGSTFTQPYDIINYTGTLTGTFTDVTPGYVLDYTSRPGEILVTAVPEPAALAIFALGLAGLGLCRRKNAKRKVAA